MEDKAQEIYLMGIAAGFLIGTFLSTIVYIIVFKYVGKGKRKIKKNPEPPIVGEVYSDKDFGDTFVKVLELSNDNSMVRYKFVEINGNKMSKDSSSSDLEIDDFKRIYPIKLRNTTEQITVRLFSGPQNRSII